MSDTRIPARWRIEAAGAPALKALAYFEQARDALEALHREGLPRLPEGSFERRGTDLVAAPGRTADFDAATLAQQAFYSRERTLDQAVRRAAEALRRVCSSELATSAAARVAVEQHAVATAALETLESALGMTFAATDAAGRPGRQRLGFVDPTAEALRAARATLRDFDVRALRAVAAGETVEAARTPRAEGVATLAQRQARAKAAGVDLDAARSAMVHRPAASTVTTSRTVEEIHAAGATRERTRAAADAEGASS